MRQLSDFMTSVIASAFVALSLYADDTNGIALSKRFGKYNAESND